MKSLILNKHLSKKETENEVSLFTREKRLKILFGLEEVNIAIVVTSLNIDFERISKHGKSK